LFAITTGWAGGDEEACILRFWQKDAKRLIKPPGSSPAPRREPEGGQEDDGKSTTLDHEDKEGFSGAIKFLAGRVTCQGDC
jgi:hypothetical protein